MPRTYDHANAEQNAVVAVAPPEHPIRLVVRDDLGRPRLLVLFRPLLALPHVVWLALWSLAAFFAAVAAWVAALVSEQVPDRLHRFLAAYVRYSTHVLAFVCVVAREFPGFGGREDSYGIDVAIDGPTRQSRWTALFRLPLAIPALALTAALGIVLMVVAFVGWWYAFVTGRMPERLRNLGAYCLHYAAQTYAYLFLLTDRYPYFSAVREPPASEAVAPEPVKRKTDLVTVLIVCALVAAAALLGVAGIRSLGEPPTGVLRVLAPPTGCWSLALGHTEEDLGVRTESGCGPTSFELDLGDGLEAQISKQPPDAIWDLGAELEVDGEVVRDVVPAPHWGVRVRYGEHVAEKTLVVRIEAADGGCWSATIDAGVRKGCGSWTFQLEVEGSVSMVFERQEPATWSLGVALEADGRVVQTYGPITDDYDFISGGYIVPRESG